MKINALASRLLGEIQRNGWKNTYYKVMERREKDRMQQGYETERQKELPGKEVLEAQRKEKFSEEILFSIVVPTYRTPEIFLRQMIESVLGQTFSGVELCIADGSEDDSVENIVMSYGQKDSRMKYRRLTENKGISENTNEALKMAEGDYIGLLDHDDVLEIHALYEIRKCLEKKPDAEVIYTDEDKVSADLTHYFDPHRKPDFNKDLLRSNNYICHFLVFKRDLLKKTGNFRSAYDGAQDFDLVLRLTEQAKEIVHIPKVLYHWRTHEASTAANPMSKLYAYEAGRKAVESHLQRCQEPAEVRHTRFYGFYEVIYDKKTQKTTKILCFSQNSEKRKKILNKFFREINGQRNGNVIYYEEGFNKIVTIYKQELTAGSEDILFFCQGNLQNLSKEGIRQLWITASRPGIGLAGGVIYGRNGKVTAGRMKKDQNGVLVCQDQGLKKGFTGEFHGSILQQNTEGVSYQLFAVRRELLETFEQKGSVRSPQEIMQQLCDHVYQKGYEISYVPGAVAYED